MEDENQVPLEPQVEEEVTTGVDTPDVEVDASAILAQLEKEKELRRTAAQYAKAKDAENKALKERLKATTAPLAVEDYIDISAALDGLDSREKSYLAEQHRLTGKPLRDIREGEDFQLWNSAYRAKMEKEAALKPSSTQATESGPMPLAERLRNASVAEKEQILRELNMYKDPRPRGERTNIGNITR